MRFIELLSPARNLECGIEAVRHGADAVYIGAPKFGARAAAGNTVADIARLVEYAHTFGVRIYVTLNTLLYDSELPEAQLLISELKQANVDALIVQDQRIRQFNPPIPLHASTQMDNRTAEQVRSLWEQGYEQTVLARELSLSEIAAIHQAVPEMPLEVFVHGALCVSYSGRCYASEHCFGRSANRGECAQFCRLPFDLLDAEGRVLQQQRHLLSLRDMNRASDLEALMDAGVSSFKIEGRLKDVSYVKNTTAYYRQKIDAILKRRSNDYCRSSFGSSTFTFIPDPQKSFNRRFTDYFLHGRTAPLACFDTPKAIGEAVGVVKDVSHQGGLSIAVAGTATFSAGDGLCFFDADHHLQGFRVNSINQQGRLIITSPSSMPTKGTALYRNLDHAFERALARPSSERRIAVRWTLNDVPADGFTLELQTEDGRSASATFTLPHELARSPQEPAIRRQLQRLGDTPYTTTENDIAIHFSDNWFIPASVLGEWRREVVSLLGLPVRERPTSLPHEALKSAIGLGSTSLHSQTPSAGNEPLMSCRYCLLHELGQCKKKKSSATRPFNEPLSLRLSDGRTFPLSFHCQVCEMTVEKEPRL